MNKRHSPIYAGFSALLMALTGLIPTTVLASKSAINFNEVVIDAPHTLTQNIIAADLLPFEGKELLTFSVDQESNRWLIIYRLDKLTNTYQVAEKKLIPQQFYRFDVSRRNDKNRNNNQESIYFLSATELVRYDNKGFVKLTEVSSLYRKEQVDFLSRGNFIQDLNNDAFDDVVITDFNKTQVFIGQKNNQFVTQHLPISPEVNIQKNGATYTEKNLYFNDTNLDNKIDIILVGDGEMVIYEQGNNTVFDQQATSLPVNEAVTGTNWWDKRDESGEPLDQSNLEYRKLEELRDVNADGIIDMVVRYTKASGVLDRVNDYEVFLGKLVDGQLTYSLQANSVIRAEGTLTGLEFIDIDNDSKLEVLVAGFEIGVSQIIGALVSGAIDQDVYVFKMTEQEQYPEDPTIKKGVELTFSLSSGQSGSPVVKLADLNGDGLKELILSNDDDELRIYLGQKIAKTTKRQRAFAKRSIGYDTQLPRDGNIVMVDDLNDDGKDDLLFKFSKLDGEGKGNTFKVLFSL
jgi:hypothetical protein